MQHGAALGLGVAGMGGKNPDAFDDLKQTLFTDSAVAGKAAELAMGLILLGTMDASSVEEMLTYARETQHKKIIWGLAISVDSYTTGIRRKRMERSSYCLQRRFVFHKFAPHNMAECTH